MYRSDRHIVEALLPVRFLASVVHFGVADPKADDAQQLLSWLKAAEGEIVAGRPDKEAFKLVRRSWSAYDHAMAPYLKEEASCAKFGLIVFYLLALLEEQGVYLFTSGGPFDQAQQAFYGPEGTIVELANIDAVDVSAQKQARRLLRSLQDMGYFPGAVTA